MDQHRIIKIHFTPSRSFMVASLRLSFPKMEAASSHCLRLMGYSLPVRECFTLEFVMRMTRPESARGTGVASMDLGQTTKKYMTDNSGDFPLPNIPIVKIGRSSNLDVTKDCWINVLLCLWLFTLPAVNEQGVPLPAKNRHKLIHNATGYTSMSVFCLLTGNCFQHLVSIICKMKKYVELIPEIQAHTPEDQPEGLSCSRISSYN